MTFRFFGRVIFISIPVIAVLGLVLTGLAAWGGYELLKKPENDFIFISEKQTQETNPPAADNQSQSQNQKSNSGNANQDKSSEISGQDTIHVYVVGCVNKPGMYEMKKGQMIYDAVEKAGGLTKNADRENINMAYILTENVMLKILPAGKNANTTGDPVTGGSTGTGSGAQIISGTGQNNGSSQQPGGKTPGKININTATEDELKTLPGIGEAKARDIIEYRSKNGPFKTIEDIMNVPGIKEARFNSLKDKICV